MKAWQGRFSEKTDVLMEVFNASIPFDQKLCLEDIEGSMAHIQMLTKIQILSESECDQLLEALHHIKTDFMDGNLSFQLSDEDIHMCIERLLTEKLGDLAKKMHTARSRNDQVATDLRLYVKYAIFRIKEELHAVMSTLVKLTEQHGELILPGMTHLQKAQPILLGFHLNAYVHMFKRDIERLDDVLKRTLVLPLGSGALSGTNYETDREYLKNQLGFLQVSGNALDAVSDRDFVIEMNSALAIVMMHYSRLSEDLIVWNTQAFDFVTFSDAFSTGSSLMPQKKNPDACELARGKTGRVYGNLMNILTVMKGLPLSYNKDMQEDKEGLFDSVETVEIVSKVYSKMLESMTFNGDNMSKATEAGFLNATELADYLVSKNMPFREAHHITGAVVKCCIDHSVDLMTLDLKTYQRYSPLIEMDVYDYLSCEVAIKNKKSYGSTSYLEVKADTKRLGEWLVNNLSDSL